MAQVGLWQATPEIAAKSPGTLAQAKLFEMPIRSLLVRFMSACSGSPACSHCMHVCHVGHHAFPHKVDTLKMMTKKAAGWVFALWTQAQALVNTMCSLHLLCMQVVTGFITALQALQSIHSDMTVVHAATSAIPPT